jgi:hypothetical protein
MVVVVVGCRGGFGVMTDGLSLRMGSGGAAGPRSNGASLVCGQKRGQAGFRSVPFFNKVEWPLFSGQQPVPALAVSFLGLRGTGMMSLSPRKVATMVVPPMVGPGGET